MGAPFQKMLVKGVQRAVLQTFGTDSGLRYTVQGGAPVVLAGTFEANGLEADVQLEVQVTTEGPRATFLEDDLPTNWALGDALEILDDHTPYVAGDRFTVQDFERDGRGMVELMLHEENV